MGPTHQEALTVSGNVLFLFLSRRGESGDTR